MTTWQARVLIAVGSTLILFGVIESPGVLWCAGGALLIYFAEKYRSPSPRKEP